MRVTMLFNTFVAPSSTILIEQDMFQIFVGHIDDSPRHQRSGAVQMYAAKKFLVFPASGAKNLEESLINADESGPKVNLHVRLHCVQRIHHGRYTGA